MIQSLVVAALVVAAVLYVGRRVWSVVASARRKKASAGCGSDGCCK